MAVPYDEWVVRFWIHTTSMGAERMSTDEFVNCFVDERNSMVQRYFDADGTTAVGTMISSLQLDSDKLGVLRQIIDGVLGDAFYNVLLALDGEASLGGRQIQYHLSDDSGEELTGGDLEGVAWEAFHGGDE
jgi:hypothetical protein